MTFETWKPIAGYEGLYEISNFGRVKSLSKVIGRRVKGETLLKVRISPYGYKMVSLCKEGKVFNASIHRLIADAFIPNPENKTQVNHKDGNKLNNDIKNLEWCTPSENINHAYKTGLHDLKKHGRTGKRKPLTQEQRDLISLRTKEAMKNPIIRKKISDARLGKKRGEGNE